jgi:hypothetical protein
VAKLGHLTDLGFESIEFGAHGATIGGVVQTVNCPSVNRYNARLQVPMRLSAASVKRETGETSSLC